ncbi:hypothetical protein H0H87_011525 [Tephrocybe sp. NHM501043]|nr:hypothetical protein H0H87_011525 [Tephrocybe sp. NHM501043]
MDALKEELESIEEMEQEMRSALDHVHALRDILSGAKKRKVTFSTVVLEALKKAGVPKKHLVFNPSKLTDLANQFAKNIETQMADLYYSRIKKIYSYVNMDVAETVSTEQRGVAILPEMRIAEGDGVCIAHPNSGYEIWLSGHVDYAVIEYDNDSEGDHKARLLNPDSSRDNAFGMSEGRLFLVEAKYQNLECALPSFIPEAVSQAIALLKSEQYVSNILYNTPTS